jgi:hypothetical protein
MSKNHLRGYENKAPRPYKKNNAQKAAPQVLKIKGQSFFAMYADGSYLEFSDMSQRPQIKDSPAVVIQAPNLKQAKAEFSEYIKNNDIYQQADLAAHLMKIGK